MAENRKSRERHCRHRQPTLLEQIQSILQKYPDGGQILKELIQNADDAGATEVSFLFDKRSHGVTSLESPDLAPFQGPALYCHNNATFKEQDWEGIRNLMKSNKKEDPLKIGRFGIGFNSVYHITDLPGIASGYKIAFFDPHEEHFKDEKGRGSSVTFFYFDDDLLQEKTRDQFMPFQDVFGCDLHDSEGYEGTLFRFPLRKTASELSPESYSEEKVLKLFDSLQTEASVVLLFLKNICSISLHKRSENGETECIFKVEIAEDSRNEVMKKRQEFLSKATTKSMVLDLKYVMKVKVMKGLTTHEYRWLVVNQIGSNVSRISELATKENLPPWIGMALPLDNECDSMEFDGRIFCFLPLPPDVDCETGLPVHVHGAFALTDNRRGLVWPGADNQSSTAEWNKLLLLNVAVEVYSKLLHVLLQNSPSIGIDECSRSQLVYSTLPSKAKVKGHWQVILDPLFQKLSKEEWRLFLAQQTSGHSWVRLQDGIVDRLVDSNMRKTVIRAFLNCSETIITDIPAHVLDILDNHFPASRVITPGLMRSLLKTQRDLKASREDKIKLLEYILEDDPSHDLAGIPLLPLANQEFSTFMSNTYVEKPSMSVFIATATCPISVLPNFDHRFLSEDVPTMVKDKLQILGSEDLLTKNATQLVLINKEIVLQNLPLCLPAEWFSNCNTTVQWSPEKASHPPEFWLEAIWSWIDSNFPDSLESFDGLPLIQLPAQVGMASTQLGVLSKQSCFIFASDVSGNFLPNVVANLLTESGCTVVPCQSSNLRHLDINTYIAPATPTGVMTVLSRTSLGKAQGFVKLCSSDERYQLREFLSRLPTKPDSAERNLLLRLALFDTLGGSGAAIGTEDDTVSVAEANFTVPDNFKFRRSNEIISSAGTSSQQLLHLLDVTTLNAAEVWVQFLFADIATLNVYSLNETAEIMLWIIARLFDFKMQCDNFIEEIKRLPFVPTDEGVLVKPSELYDPGDAIIVNLFHGEPNKFPRNDYCSAHVISMLRDQMGLRTRDKITPNELFEVATRISASSRCKLQALVKILSDNPEYLKQSVNSGVVLKSELLGIKWLPHATASQTVCPRFPPSMPWFACDQEYFAPPDLCDKSYALIAGSAMPVLDIDLSQKVREELGFIGDPPLKHVVAQLKIAMTVWSSLNERKVCGLFKEMLVAIYNQLARCPKETVCAQLSQVCAEHWIWHGDGFCSPYQISFKIDIPLDLRPQLFLLPDELRDDAKLEQFFLESGVRSKFAEDDIISVLPALKQKHETPDVDTADVEKDLKLCRSILEWFDGKSLSQSMKEILLFPVESEANTLVLKHYMDCVYCDADWLRRKESEFDIPDEYSIIHNSVPTKIAISHGVPKLSSCLLSAETLDFDLGIEKSGPSEPITKRIHNILEDYKEGVGVFKELIQNADDAKASKVRFLIDWRVGPKDRLLADGMSECQGPALWAYNDGLFSDSDFENINKLAGATKKKDISTIGRFGLGFNAVYHLTDVPSFVSREYIVMFDPNCHHLQKHITDASQPGIRINLAKFPRPLKVFENQFQPYHGIFDCNMKYDAQESFHFPGTLFRFPFRTLVQAGKSDICQKVYDEDKVKTIVDSLTESASLLLVYTEHISEVELFELKSNENPKQMRPILSVRKNADSPGDGEPFIKTCSKWWGEKMRNEATLSECPAKSQCITININKSITSSSGEIVHSRLQESWLINSCMGTGSSSALALGSEGQEKGLMPFAETAAKINCEETTAKIPRAVSGEVFCFLPLSIPTGLPVHINGYFAVMSNRRAIWEPGTTEHDKPFEGDWNASLLSDAIASSYTHLLLEIKSNLSTDATKSLQAMLPCYNTLHSATWEPLVKSIYDKIINESLAIFWCNEQWLDIHSGFILDDSLCNAPGVITTMNSLGENVLDLTEDVCKSFKKAGHEDTIQNRTLTLERFFHELFFPNISRITNELREPLVRFGLGCIVKGYEGIEKLFKDNECILNDDGQLKKPNKLFDPHDSELQDLFFHEAGKFPHEDFVDENTSHFSVLKKLGLRSKDMIMAEELLSVAKNISVSEFSDLLIKKSKALVNILQSKEQYLSQAVNGCSTLKQELQDVKWLPRSRTPPESCRYPEKMPWLDVEDAFFSPAELRGKSQALLIGSCMPVVDIIPENHLVEFGVISELPLESVVDQLSKAVHLLFADPHMKITSQFHDLVMAIYHHLADVPQDKVSRALTQANLAQWIWHGAGFCSPLKISFKMDIPFDLRPRLFLLPDELKSDAKLEQFFLKSGVRSKFSEDDIISVLPAMKEKHETPDVDTADIEKDLKLCRSILEWLEGKNLSESMKEKLLFPIESQENILVFQHYKDCAYCDADWLRREESLLDSHDSYPLIHNSVPTKIAVSLGVPKLSACLLSAESLDFDLGIEKSGPSEPITKRIHNILEDYKEGVGVFKELIQNADDAGASKVRFLIDWRVGPKDRLLADGMSECQGPALWAYNDGLFSDGDFENINKLAGATKKQDISTIGRFGLGFNAVYHLTDVPSFVSREYIVMFDPNCHHLEKHITDPSQPGIRINLAKFPRPLKVFENQFQPYHGIFNCNVKYDAQESFHFPGTLFRFPFRTLVQAGKSDICQKVYDEYKVKTIVDSLTESASLLLVYTEHVSEVELFELKRNENPKQMRPILSVRKNVDSPGDGEPFIKTCSKWWGEKMRNEATLSECPAKSQYITINITKSIASSSGEIEHSRLQESWLINSCMGTGSSSALALGSEGQEKGLMPFAETAAKINCEESTAKIPRAVSGEVFCFLPLSIPTGLPVHINGYFAVMSNRRAIWEPGTTEHDKPFEGDWNASLLSDAIASSYTHLLLEIKSNLSKDATKCLQAMLPYYHTLHSATWEPLVKSIYDKIINESLAIFWCNEQWLDIHSGFILDDSLCNAPGVIITLNSLGENVLDLTEDVCKSFKKAGHEDTIQTRTLTLERFFQELFFPNISRITHELREPLVRFGLGCILKGYEGIEKLFKDNECILNDDGQLKKPNELFDPHDSELQDLFFHEAGKFPHEDFVDENTSHFSVLKKLGLRSKDMIMAEELLSVAKNISVSEFSDLLIKKSKALVNILQSKEQYLSQAVNGCSTLKQELQDVKWLPRSRTPPQSCRYPEKMPWLDVEDAFFSPAELRGKSQALLIGSCMPVVDVIPENHLVEFGVISELPLESVVDQLSKAVNLFADPHMKITSQFHDLVMAIYQHLADVPQDKLSRALTQADLAHWIWHGAGFCSPFKISFKMDIPFDLRPQLFLLPDELSDDAKLEQFFLKSGVRSKFSEDDIISVLPALKQKHETPDVDTADIEKDLKLCRSILEWLEGKRLSESMKENLLFPTESEENILVLQHYKDCAYCDADWLRREESLLDSHDSYPLIHNSVPTKIAVSLGVPKLSSCLLSAESLDFDLGIEKSGPSEPITKRIHNILEDYKEGVGVFKELIQNADDAGASKVRFLIDWRVGPKDRLLADGMSECQGPALWAYNDGLFSDGDFENINKLAGATKKQDISTIGRFGLGFNAVYHLTDVPSFVSREYIVMFDPNCHHLHVTDASQPGIRINLAKFPKPLKLFENQFQPYQGIFDCNMKCSAQESFYYQGTLFRFPFRTLVQAGKSKICQKVYDEDKVKTIVDSLTESASLLLVYTEHVSEVELFELKNNENPKQMRPILSVRKSADGPSDGEPFIKTCSKWWREKMRNETFLVECPAKSQCITININKSFASSSGDIQHSRLQESWLINSCMGTGSSSALALGSEGQEKGLMPFAETAAKINCEESTAKIPRAVSGEVFCFLPLSIPTGLPVHINGYFAVMSNRRAIWEPGTTEHDKPFEGDWNASLLSDAIASSYTHLLLEIKSNLSTDATKSLQAMLPCYNTLHSATWEPLVKSIYDKIVNESLAIFWCNDQWLDIHSGFILDDSLCNAPGVIITLNSLGENVLDLTEDVCKSFKKAGHEDTIQNRTLTLERFFQELFFPNISKIAHELREPLVRFGLDCILKGYAGIEKLFKDNECILNDDSQLKKPNELFDPHDSELQDLFFHEAGKFPHEDFVDENTSHFSVLKKLGLRSKDMIMAEELLSVAKNISVFGFSDLLIKKSKALVNILQSKEQYLSQAVNGCSTLKQELQDVKWLPRSRTPPQSCRYPEKMPWLDVEDAFFSPAELRGKSQALLIGSCMPVVDIIPENQLVEFGVISELPLESVVDQLSKAVHLLFADPHMKITSQFHDLVVAIYQHLADVPQDKLSRALTQVDLAHWIWHGAGFASPTKVAIEALVIVDLRPYLFYLPDYLHQHEALKEFFVRNGVRGTFSKQDIISVLSSVKSKHESGSSKTTEEMEHDLELCRFIVEWLVESGDELSADLQEKVMMPIQRNDKSLVLKPCKDCTYCDHEWLRQGGSEVDIPDELFLIDELISEKVARLLGVKPLSTCLMSGEKLDFELTGQREPLTTRLNNILSEYKQGGGVFKELIQNADDAGATKVCFLIDWREGPKKSLFSPAMSECQGPALWAYNDAVFSDDDFKNINKLAGKTKIEDFEKIGRFGLGFNSVYHLTDVPSFLSRQYLVIFDPNIHHLIGKVTHAHPGLRIDLAKNSRPLKTFSDQFQPYHDIFQCSTDPQNKERFNFNGTLFRFPFRTKLQANRSEISKEIYNEKKVKELVESLRECLSLVLLYTQSVNEVEVYELDKNQNPQSMHLIVSTKKGVKSLNVELNAVLSEDRPNLSFIKECSEWWKKSLSKGAVLSAGPYRSEIITIEVKEQEEEKVKERKEQWLVSSCMGTDASLEMAMNEGKKDGLLPCAGTAAKLSSDTTLCPEAICGEAFCFLPLSIATGLPVHINSSFAVAKNRRSIWEKSTSQHQDLEVRWNESLMSDPLCNAYIQLLENMKSLCENGVVRDYPFHVLWPCDPSDSWETLVKSIYTTLVEDSLQLLRSNGRWLDIHSGYVLADDFRKAPNISKAPYIIEAMQCLTENVFELPENVCTMLKKYEQEKTLQERTLTLERFFTTFFAPNMVEFPHELRNSLVQFGLDCILSENEELESLFKYIPSIPCSQDGNILVKPDELINPKGAAAELFSSEDNRFPVGSEFLTENRVFVLEKLGMKKDLLSWEEICERARNVKILAETCYDRALLRSRKLVEYLNKHIKNLPAIQEDGKTFQDICFLPFIKEPPPDYKNGLPWKGLKRNREEFCSPKELFIPRYIGLVGSCCLILSTHDKLGCGKLERSVKGVLGMSQKHPSPEQVLEQLDNVIEIWSTFKKEDRDKISAKILKICHCVYEYLNEHFVKRANAKDGEMKDVEEMKNGQEIEGAEETKDGEELMDGEEMKDNEEELIIELAKRRWLFLDNTFVSSDQAARYWCKNGAPYLYGVPEEYNTKYKSLLQMTNVKENFDTKDFLKAINSLRESKGCSPLSDGELDVALAFLNELENIDDEFCEENSDHFYLPDKSKVLVKADALTINNTPWLPERGDSHSVHKRITSHLAFKLGAKTLFGKRLEKYSKTLGTPFGQQEKLKDRLKSILKSYPCDSGILKELVQNADDARATEIHFIYDQRTLPCEQVLQKNAKEIHGPALCVYNNQAFSESDFEGIQKLGIGSKTENAEKTGQFGIGFNSVYHLTDCPSIISNSETLCILDPHCRHAPHATYEYPGERFDSIDQEFRDDFADMMTGYLEDFGFNLQGSTMFRLPLRNLERSQHSEISNRTAIHIISTLLEEFKREAKRSILFLKHIKKISISGIDRTGKFATTYEVTSHVDEKDMNKLNTLLSHKNSSQGQQTKDISWHGVTFPLVLGDTDGCVEHWLVHQCFGVNVNGDESEEIPDGRDHKILPYGGLAALIESNQRPSAAAEAPRYFAYCFLPLPVRTSLPVHVNGHFALDSGRRDLWKDADLKDPLAVWNTMIKRNVLAPGYASLILEAQKYMQFCEREVEDKTSYFFPGKVSAEIGLFWYYKLFPKVLDDVWSPLTLKMYALLADDKKPVLPVVIADEPKENKRPDDMPRRIQRWLSVHEVFFVDLTVTRDDSLMEILLEIKLPVVGHSPLTVQQGFEKAGYVPRVVSPDSVVQALRDFSSSSPECKIGLLPCNIQDTTIGSKSKLGRLISYCKKGKNFLECLPGLPLLLTADGVLREFSQEEKVYCSTFSDLFPERAHKFVHPDIVSCLSSVLNEDKVRKAGSGEISNDSSNDSTANSSFPTVLLHLTADVVDTFMSDVFPPQMKDSYVHLDFDETGVSEEWLKRLWAYLQTYSKKVDDSKRPLDALKSWPIIPTVSKKLVTVKMAKTVIDMTLVGNESDAAISVRESLKNLNCPCLDTAITLPNKEPCKSVIGTVMSFVFARQPASKEEPLISVTKSYVAHPYSVPDVLDVFDFMLKRDSIDANALSDHDITTILQFIQNGYENLQPKEKYNEVLKQLPFYKSINGKHYKLSEFSEYAVIPADVPAEEIDKLQDYTHCLFLHSDMLPSLEKLLNKLNAGAKRSNAEFYRCYILPNFTIFSDKMRFQYLIHIRDKVIPNLYDDLAAKDEFLNDLNRTRCIPNKNGEYVHPSDFYDPRNQVFRTMEDESSNKFPPPPFNETKWLDFLVSIGMIKDVSETLFKKFASRVARNGNSSPDDKTNRERSKVLSSFFFTNHHLHGRQILQDLSTVKFIASQKVEDVYLSLHKQYCCTESSDYPPFVQFSNAVLWKYRSLVWTSANLLPEWKDVSYICNQHQECKIEDIYDNLAVKYPSSEMVISHLQNISEILAESSNKEQKLPQNAILTKTMNNIYEFLYATAKCPKREISPECSNTCALIGNRLASSQCILVPADNPKAVVKGNQLSFQIPENKSLVPFIYQVPREYGSLQHLLKRLGATEAITPLQLVSVFKKMKDRTRDKEMNPEIKKKAHNAMFLLFQSVLNETATKKEESSIASVRELFLPSVDNRLINSSELLCKIPPRHIETISRLDYRALCFFEACGLQRDLESKYLEALPEKLRPKPFQDVVKETLDESCLERPCQLCDKNDDDCDFIKELKVLLKSEQFKNGLIRLLKHQKDSNKLSDEDEEAASRLFLNKVEFKCMERVLVHLLLVKTNEVLEKSSTRRKCFVVRGPRNDAWTLYIKHGEVPSNLAKSINKILDWKVRDDLLLAVSGMLVCKTPLEIPGVLNQHDIKVDAGKNEDVKLGSKVPCVFHQLLQQNPLFEFYDGERVAYCSELPDEGDADGERKYILAEIIRCVTSNPTGETYDLKARYLIDIGSEKIEVSVLDLYKFYEDYPDENSCQDLVPFKGDVAKKPESYDEAKREILEALRAAWRLPLDLRRKAIHRLYLRWHPDKNPDNPEFAAEMMKFLLEQIERMKKEEQGLAGRTENFDFDRCNRQASRESATFHNYRSYSSFSTPGFRPDSTMFDSAESYTTPNPREAKRWVEQAEGDLSACQHLRTKPFDAMACFTSQQVVEKCLKAALYYECGLASEQLHTHDIYTLVSCVSKLRRWKNDEVVRLALVMADYYLPTRYPNRLPYPEVPHNSFDGKSGDASSSAAEILRLVKAFINN